LAPITQTGALGEDDSWKKSEKIPLNCPFEKCAPSMKCTWTKKEKLKVAAISGCKINIKNN